MERIPFFSITDKDSYSQARTGALRLQHGDVSTPAFMPVGTNGAVKAMRNEDIESLGINLILANAYHLYLRPGLDVIRKSGDLRRFMAWEHNILTDSGGFQVFSLAPFRKIERNGVRFRSHIDGSYHNLTPVDVIRIQETLGSDILMPLDICTAPFIPEAEAEAACDRTHEWACESMEYYDNNKSNIPGSLFAIIQGNFYKALREKSARGLVSLDFPGYAIGGLSVGEDFEEFMQTLELTARIMPYEKPRYLMGVGTPAYILEAVQNGIDLFDCVFPTRVARNAYAFTRLGPLNLRLERNKLADGPIDPDCGCQTCKRYSRSYIRHLFKSREINACVLTTFHNLFFIQELILKIRESIRKNEFMRFKLEFTSAYSKPE